jgi:hypothetical protein
MCCYGIAQSIELCSQVNAFPKQSTIELRLLSKERSRNNGFVTMDSVGHKLAI